MIHRSLQSFEILSGSKKSFPSKILFLKNPVICFVSIWELVLAGTGGGAGNTAVLRGEPYQLAGSLRPPGGARMIYSVIEHPCRRGRNRTATPTVRNVRAAPPPPPPPPRVEDVYVPATVSLSSRGPGTALFLSCRHCRRRWQHCCYRRHTLPGLSFAPSIRRGARLLPLNIPVN